MRIKSSLDKIFTQKKTSKQSPKQHDDCAIPGTGRATTPGERKGQINELSVMSTLHKYGWLTSRQIGELCWANNKDPLQMARKVTRRLVEKNLIISRELPNRTLAHVLTSAGAEALNNTGLKNVKRGTDLLRGKTKSSWFHRWLANQHCIGFELEGATVYTEYEILGYRSPLTLDDFPASRGFMGKIPDCITTHQRSGQLRVHWIEIEISRRKSDDQKRLSMLITKGMMDREIFTEKTSLEAVTLVYAYDQENPETGVKICKMLNATAKSIINNFSELLQNYTDNESKNIIYKILGMVAVCVYNVGQGPMVRGKPMYYNLYDLIYSNEACHFSKEYCPSFDKLTNINR